MSLARDNQVIRTTIRFHSRETSERNPARLRLSKSGKSLAPPLLNGLVTEALETIPETTVCLKIGGYRLEILQTEENRVSRVLIWHNSVKPAV